MTEYRHGEVRFYLQQPSASLRGGWFDAGYYFEEKAAITEAKHQVDRFGVDVRVVRRTRNPDRSERVVWRSSGHLDLRRE